MYSISFKLSILYMQDAILGVLEKFKDEVDSLVDV